MLQKIKHSAFFMVVVILLTSFISNTSGAGSPWDPYKQYLPDNVPTVRRQLRGLWISTVYNLDWPSSKARDLKDPQQRIKKCKDELIAILDRAAEMNMNAVFFQVSPEGDALYKSEIVPWSRYLTGTFGKDPGFDPLAFAIEAAHDRNLEIHAWFNPYRVSANVHKDTVASLNVNLSVYKEHPEWIRTAAGRLVVDPGIPEARKWVADRVMEVVRKYDIDGIHFDDYFYNESYKGELQDGESFKEYGSDFATLEDWRRNNTYLLIRDISNKIRWEKPWIKFGVSPGGVWANIKDGHPDGSNTNTDYTNYGKCFADTKRWVEEELIDYIAPQIYYTFANQNAPYGELAEWWSNTCKGKNVHLYIGLAFYKINDDGDTYFKGNNAVPEISRQLTLNMLMPGIEGSILFRASNLNDALKQPAANALKNVLWPEKALIPVMPWKSGKAPRPPSEGKFRREPQGIVLSWVDNDPNTTYFAVYRFRTGEKADISDDSAGELIATVRKKGNGVQEYIDTESANGVFYVITAVDRVHNQGDGLTITESQTGYFPDVGPAHAWAVGAIDALYEQGIIAGTAKGLFLPGNGIKRGDFVLMVVRAFDLWREFDSCFSDVHEDSYYYDAIGSAKESGIVLGSNGCFYPESLITREDIVVILARTLDVMGVSPETAEEEILDRYLDKALISNYAKEAMAVFTKANIVQGSNGKIHPKNNATRAETAVILHRFLSNYK